MPMQLLVRATKLRTAVWLGVKPPMKTGEPSAGKAQEIPLWKEPGTVDENRQLVLGTKTRRHPRIQGVPFWFCLRCFFYSVGEIDGAKNENEFVLSVDEKQRGSSDWRRR